jgi:Cullin family
MPRTRTVGPPAKKVVIRPYSKPPSLPPNYYETTADALWEGLETRSNLQQAYTQVVHLVSHAMGPRLYQDLRNHLRQVARKQVQSATNLLRYIPAQYQDYLDYLLLCRHVFLPLDRTHGWHQETAVPWKTSSTLLTSLSSSTSAPWTLWQVGLNEFAQRLRELQLDSALYQEWLQALLQDWNNTSNAEANWTTLKAVWYMWQDLGQLHSLSLQTDLEDYWKRESLKWRTDDYKAASFLQLAFDKHNKVQVWQPWLPASWLWNILDHCFFEPHLTPQYLLLPANLYPLLQQALHSPTTQSHSIQQL